VATHNGSKYVLAQLASIVDQLDAADEIVVVDDASTDQTPELIAALNEPRVRLIRLTTNVGYVAAFEHALGAARYDLILLADQDDEWVPGRVQLMRTALAEHAVVAGNLVTLNGPDAIRGPYGQRSWRLRSTDSPRKWRNTVGILVGNRPYYGSAMGLNRQALDIALPFPGIRESHDLWIALCGNQLGSIRHLEENVTARRYHDSNQTPERPRVLPAVLRSRLMLLRLIRVARSRIAAGKRR
jgi:glycosyltransferase involved in cell wall biosynthesis